MDNTEHINYGVYVKQHIIDEDNNYTVEYKTLFSNVAKTFKGSFEEHFTETSMLQQMGINGKYSIFFDLNVLVGVTNSCKMIPILSDDAVMLQCGDSPFSGDKKVLFLHIVPEKQQWIKKVLLNDAQIEQARKIMLEIDEQPFQKKKRKVSHM